MFRSGSTWQYQVAIDLIRRSHQVIWQHGCPLASDVLKLAKSSVDSNAIHIIKTHVPDPALREYFDHPGFRLLYSYRDLRDIAFSMAHKISDTFDTTVHKWHYLDQCLALEALWTKAPPQRKVVQRYETWIVNPQPYVLQIADCLGIEITPTVAKEICEEYSIDQQKQRAADFARNLRAAGIDLKDKKNALHYDEGTMLHWNHIREGRVGHWRALATPEQKLELLGICGPWLIANGYEKNNDWAFAEIAPSRIQAPLFGSPTSFRT